MTSVATSSNAPHRSITVQKISNLTTQLAGSTSAAANSNRNLILAQLWSQCASSVSYTSSVATGAIVDLVQKDALGWSDALQGFENALSTCQGQALANIVHALTSLFISASEASSAVTPKKNTTVNRNVFTSKNNRHPFITLISSKPQVETTLFAEMDKIMDYRPDSAPYRLAAFDILSPFIDFCLLDRSLRTTIVSSSIVLWISKTLNACLLDPELEPLVVHLFNHLCSVATRFPLDQTRPCTPLQTTIRTLVDLYCLPSTQLTLSTSYKEVLGSRLLLIVLSWTADMRRFGLATLPLMQMAQTLFRNRKGYTAPQLDLDVLWPMLSLLLMDSPTVDEQRIIVDWMYAIITSAQGPMDAMIANLAFLPIFQVMGETHSDAVSKKCSEVLQKLETIPRTKKTRPHHPSSEHILTTGVAAMVQAEVAHLRQAWYSAEDVDSGTLLSLGDDATFSSLAYTTFMFHPQESKRIEAITQQAQIEEGRLVTLVLFIYVLRVDPSPLVKLHLLQEAIPALVSSKDEMVTAKVLKTILTLIHGVPNAPAGTKVMSTHMGAVGVRILFLIWKRQPRIWKTLRHIIHEWVEGRPRLFKTPLKGESEYDMEVAILTTIRDICAFDAAGYAEVLIPFLANLLGSVELYASSICTIIETMNLTVEASVVEPRAAWNVLLCHVAEHAMKTQHLGLLQEMCIFYGIIGSRNEDTQVFLDLREAVLNNYIQPLLSSEDPEVLASALKALSCFSALEIVTVLLTESPAIYIRGQILEAQDSMVVDEYSMILDKLVRYELQHMRRGLFKDAATKKATPDAVSGAKELDRLQGVLSVVAGNILQKWQSGDVNPGLRTGYALSSLLCSSVVEKQPATADENDSAEAIKAQQSYWNVMTAIKDVTLTDHLVERISALEGWTSFFDKMWVPNDDSQTLAIAETLIEDLYKKITEGYVPAHCANALLAITGITLSLHRHSHPASTVQSSALAKHLLQHYVRPETLSDVGGSDEVQFAVLVSLSFITPLAAVDEKLVTEVLGVFTDRLSADAAAPALSSDLSNWSAFAAGWAFCNLLAGLVDSPTKTAELNEICHQTLKKLIAVFDSDTASFALTLGILIAFSRLSVAITSSSSHRSNDGSVNVETEAVQKIKAMARGDLEEFLNDQQKIFNTQALARLLGAPWVLAFSDATEASSEERKSDTELLDGALLAATSRRDLQSQLVHFTVPFCHLIHTNLDVRNPTSSEISLFTGRIHSLVNLIRITPTSAARHTAVVALGSLFGINWSRGPTVASVSSHGLFSYMTASTNPAAMASVTNSALTTLAELAGLSISIAAVGSVEASGAYATVIPGFKAPSPKSMLMVQDLKAGRLASMILGHVACHFYRLGQVDSGKVIGTSSEPKDYSRLPLSTSWLRGLWDALWEPLQMGTVQRAQKSYATSLELLLYTVHSLPTPLPAVNWFPLLTRLVAMEPTLIVPAIHVASKHATTSTSLMEFLIMSLSSFKLGERKRIVVAADDESVAAEESAEELFVGEEGLGRILTLGGLPLLDAGNDQAQAELDKVRGLDGLAKRVTLPNSRVVDLVEKLIRVLFFHPDGTQRGGKDPEIEVLQLVFLDTLSNHMRQYRQGERPSLSVKLVHTTSLTDDAKDLLGELRSVILRIFYLVSFKDTMTAQRVLHRLADLSLMSISHLDAAHVDSSVRTQDHPDAGSRVLKDAIGITSLYRAGYLPPQQEGRLIQVTQSALLVVSGNSGDASVKSSSNRQLAEAAISVLLYAMNASVGVRSTSTMTAQQTKKHDMQRLIWLQRILDLLVLLSSQPEIFRHGLTLLLGGAVLLWWDEKEVLSIRRQQDTISLDVAASTVMRLNPMEDAEANLMAMADDHEEQQQHRTTGGTFERMDYNILEDDGFELWHQEFTKSVSVYAGEDHEDSLLPLLQERQWSVSSRLSLILPDIVMNIRGNGSSSASDSQIANRLLRLALDPHVGTFEKQFLIALLRRMEQLVPAAQDWVLK